MSEKRRIEIDDLYRYTWVADAQISPDGQLVAYVQSHIDRDEDEYRSRVWMVPAEEGEAFQFTNGTKDTHPRWSPDGRNIAFLSGRGDPGGAQIWVIPTDGGEAQQLTDLDVGVKSFCWSPDGERIAFTASLPEEELGGDSCGGEDTCDDDDGVRIITRMRYKLNGVGFTYDRYSHVFVVNVDGGEPVRITDGLFSHDAPAWDPDGESVACTATRCDDPDYANYSDVYLFPADGSAVSGDASPVKLTDSRGPASAPLLDPDGRLLYVGHDNRYYGATLPTLYLRTACGDEVSDLLGEFEPRFGGGIGGDCRYGGGAGRPVLSDDTSEIFFLSGWRGACNLYAVDTLTSRVQQITDADWTITAFSQSTETGAFALVAEDAVKPGDIWICEPKGGLRQLTAVNEWLDDVKLSCPQEIEFTGAKGRKIQGWVMMPSDDSLMDDEGSYPMVLEIHGGPHAAYGHGYYHEFHVLSARGYGVLYVNPHGSSGYGQAFNAATHHDWGGKDYTDLMRAVDLAIATMPFDPERLGVTGGSFGGYMTNWIVGHTDRFQAAVTQRSSSNRYSMFGTSDVGFNHGTWEFPGYPWANPTGYLERSPITYAENVDTPMLIIHSENDLRCPITQAEEWFIALKRLKKEAVFARFADESHDLSRSGKPRRRIRRLSLIADWFDEHID